MSCRNCPYGKEDFERRIFLYENFNGYGRNIKGDAYDHLEEFVWCDKVGGKVYCFGKCTDACPVEKEHRNFQKKKRKNKRERLLSYKRRMKYLSSFSYSHICCNDDSKKKYYKRLYESKTGSPYPYYKKYSNRKIRRYKKEIQSGGYYKKIFDFMYVL